MTSTRPTSPASVEALIFFCFFSSIKGRKEEYQDKKNIKSRKEEGIKARKEDPKHIPAPLRRPYIYIYTPKNEMKKNKRLTTVAAALSIVLLLTAAKAGDGVITKENGMTVINTTELTRDVKGYQSPTPVKIFIKQNKVVRVEALPNQETPKFFDRAKAILTFWDGKAVSQAVKEAPDAVTGATLSSEALKKNVRVGLEHYNKQQQKKKRK